MMVILKNIKRRQDMDLVIVIVVDSHETVVQAVQVDSALFNHVVRMAMSQNFLKRWLLVVEVEGRSHNSASNGPGLHRV